MASEASVTDGSCGVGASIFASDSVRSVGAQSNGCTSTELAAACVDDGPILDSVCCSQAVSVVGSTRPTVAADDRERRRDGGLRIDARHVGQFAFLASHLSMHSCMRTQWHWLTYMYTCAPHILSRADLVEVVFARQTFHHVSILEVAQAHSASAVVLCSAERHEL